MEKKKWNILSNTLKQKKQNKKYIYLVLITTCIAIFMITISLLLLEWFILYIKLFDYYHYIKDKIRFLFI